MKNINIQFLRAVAAISVVFYHTADHFFVMDKEKEGNIFSFFSQIGYMGVDIFFVISGYIMWISTKKLPDGSKGVSKFIISRFIRIFPVYWVFLSLVFYYHYRHHALQQFDLFGSVFLTFSSTSKLLLPVAWTLQYELYFYILFAGLLFIGRKYIVPLFIVIFGIIVALHIYGSIALDIYNPEHYNDLDMFWLFWSSPLILEFISGVFIGYFFDRYRLKYTGIIMVIIAVLLFIAFYVQSNVLHGSLALGYYTPYRVTILGTISVLLVAIAVEWHLRGVQFLQNFSTLLGDASYSLYLSHTILFLFFYSIGLRDLIAQTGFHLPLMVLWAMSAVFASILFYKLIEAPMLLKLKRRFLPR